MQVGRNYAIKPLSVEKFLLLRCWCWCTCVYFYLFVRFSVHYKNFLFLCSLNTYIASKLFKFTAQREHDRQRNSFENKWIFPSACGALEWPLATTLLIIAVYRCVHIFGWHFFYTAHKHFNSFIRHWNHFHANTHFAVRVLCAGRVHARVLFHHRN